MRTTASEQSDVWRRGVERAAQGGTIELRIVREDDYRRAVREFYPGYFAAVMATGVLSIALWQRGDSTLAATSD